MQYLTIAPVASIIFIITIITSLMAFNNHALYGKFMLHPYSVSRNAKLHTYITSGLIHLDWGHLFFNMFTFFAFAFTLEQYLGHWQFGFLYIASLIASDIPTVIKNKNNFNYNSLGASGAISAVLFSYILFNPLNKLYIMFIPIGIPAVLFGVLYLVYCAYASKNSRDSINHDAHFFGALSGLIITVILKPNIIPHFISMLTGN